jgi:hypothetical protein
VTESNYIYTKREMLCTALLCVSFERRGKYYKGLEDILYPKDTGPVTGVLWLRYGFILGRN